MLHAPWSRNQRNSRLLGPIAACWLLAALLGLGAIMAWLEEREQKRPRLPEEETAEGDDGGLVERDEVGGEEQAVWLYTVAQQLSTDEIRGLLEWSEEEEDDVRLVELDSTRWPSTFAALLSLKRAGLIQFSDASTQPDAATITQGLLTALRPLCAASTVVIIKVDPRRRATIAVVGAFLQCLEVALGERREQRVAPAGKEDAEDEEDEDEEQPQLVVLLNGWGQPSLSAPSIGEAAVATAGGGSHMRELSCMVLDTSEAGMNIEDDGDEEEQEEEEEGEVEEEGVRLYACSGGLSSTDLQEAILTADEVPRVELSANGWCGGLMDALAALSREPCGGGTYFPVSVLGEVVEESRLPDAGREFPPPWWDEALGAIASHTFKDGRGSLVLVLRGDPRRASCARAVVALLEVLVHGYARGVSALMGGSAADGTSTADAEEQQQEEEQEAQYDPPGQLLVVLAGWLDDASNGVCMH
jgi:hypothetical protein